MSETPESVLPRLVAGLGNPGRRYSGTRHNIGFMVVDRIASEMGERWATEKKWDCEVVRCGRVILIKPTTFMNESGRAVRAVSRFFKVEPEEILVVYDDLDLPLGRLRLRERGSAGGHNGIKSIIHQLDTNEFPRLKVGIGRSDRANTLNHVLGDFSEEERVAVDEALAESLKAVTCVMESGMNLAMNRFNTPAAKKRQKAKKERTSPMPAPQNSKNQEETEKQRDDSDE
ncbi:MAG: aminoacyl-tRNA hydrolase [Verrucomicrobiota bacterium]